MQFSPESLDQVATSCRRLRLSAPSRLHFGLFAVTDQGPLRYGGLGVMVRQPGLQLELEPASKLEAAGPQSDRVLDFARRWLQANNLSVDAVCCRLRVSAAPPSHAGLGSGTQLGLAVAALLHCRAGQAVPPATELARSVCRGRRSAVGTHGFLHGGLILDAGKTAAEELGTLSRRVELPDRWHWVLWFDGGSQGLAGKAEEAVFEAMVGEAPGNPDSLSELAAKAANEAKRADFSAFSETLFEFGYLAGSRFASFQGGPFNGRHLAARIEQLRSWGVQGVGQSSWGPTLFALLPSAEQAHELVQRTASCREFQGTTALVSRTAAAGYEIESVAGVAKTPN